MDIEKLMMCLNSVLTDQKIIEDARSWVDCNSEDSERIFGFDDEAEQVKLPENVTLSVISKCFCISKFDSSSLGKNSFIAEVGVGEVEKLTGGGLAIEFFFLTMYYNFKGDVVNHYWRRYWSQ